MKLGIVLYSNDPETVWNVFRFGNFSLKEGDEVKMFLLAKGVECESGAIAVRTSKVRSFDCTNKIRAVKSSRGPRDSECESLDTDNYNITEQIQAFVDNGGSILACGTCLQIRNSEGSEICPLSTMADLYRLVGECDKVLTF